MGLFNALGNLFGDQQMQPSQAPLTSYGAPEMRYQQPDVQEIANDTPRLTQKRGIGNVLSDFFSGDRIAANMRDPGIAAWGDALGNIERAVHGEPLDYSQTNRALALQDRFNQDQARNAFADIFNNPDNSQAMQQYAKFDPKGAMDYRMAQQKAQQEQHTPFQRDVIASGFTPGTPEYAQAMREAMNARYNQQRIINVPGVGPYPDPTYEPLFQGGGGQQPQQAPQQQGAVSYKGADGSLKHAWLNPADGQYYDNPEFR